MSARSITAAAPAPQVLGGIRELLGLGRKRSLAQLDDTALVERAGAGRDHAAFAELVSRHQGRVRSLLLRLSSDPALADDLSQEVFIRAYRALAGFEGRARVSTWLYRIAYNVFINHRTRTKVTGELTEDMAGALADTNLRGGATHSDMHRDVAAAVDQLPPAYRAAVLLYYVEDLSYPEIAEVLELPLGTVKTHLHRAKRHLRDRLEGWEGSGDTCL